MSRLNPYVRTSPAMATETTVVPRPWSERLRSAEILFEEQRWKKAESICEDLLSEGIEPGLVTLLSRIYVKNGSRQKALPLLRKAVDCFPSSAQAHFSLAEFFQTSGQNREAAEAWVGGLRIDPTHLPGHLALTQALLALGLLDAAITSARHALLAAPDSPDAHELLGLVYETKGQRPQAIEHYSRSLALRPGVPRVCHRLSGVLRAEGRLESARALLEELLVSTPRDAGTLFLRAGIVSEMGAVKDAIVDLRRTLAIQPQFPEALNTLAVLLRSSGDLTQAEVYFRRAIAQRSNYAAAWNNLANLYVELSRVEEAERCYSKAVMHLPGYAEAHTNRALVWLLQGKFQEGWAEYEWRWRQPGISPRTLSRPQWDGGPVEGKTILLHAEQGAGDTIQFIRYARLLQRQGATVVLHCQESLRSLLSGMPELAAVVTGRAVAPDFDVHAPLMSLPRLFGTTATTIPVDSPYLRPLDHAPVPELLCEPRFGPNRLRAGLVWAGNAGHRNDRNRSCPAELLDGLLQTDGVQFFSLQVGHSTSSIPSRSIVDLAPYLTDYAATAACLAHLDLLVTVDTSVAHLAGALGRPVWLLLPTCNDWRWLVQREDTPWYPTMRLFRQARRGDWKTVLERVGNELKRLIASLDAPTGRSESYSKDE